MEKPDVLSENHELKVSIQEIFNLWCVNSWADNEVIDMIFKLIQPIIKQARQDTARGLIEEIEQQEIIQRRKDITIWLDCHWWQSLKSKYLIPPNPVGSADV